MSNYVILGSLGCPEIWVKWRRKLFWAVYPAVVGFVRRLLEHYRGWFPSLITFRGIKVSNDPKYLSDEAFSALILQLYERSEFNCLPHLDRLDQPILELGGSIGIISCALSKLIDAPSHIIVEGNPSLMPILEHHLQLNGVERYTLLNRVVIASEAEGMPLTQFASGIGSLNGRAADDSMQGQVDAVGSISLAALYREQIKDGYFTLFCDIEGMEVECLFHDEARAVLAHINQAVIEFHTVIRDGTSIPPEQSAANFAVVTGLKACFRHGYVWIFRSAAA